MTIRKDTDELISFLNSLVEIDRYAIAELLCTRVVCNEVMAGHPTVQVAAGSEKSNVTYIAPGQYRVGILGILNGYCGTIDDDGPRRGWGPIAAVYDQGRLQRFERSETAEFKTAPPIPDGV